MGRSGATGLDYEDFIQTDAAINPGNSGGALVDMKGRLIGLNTAILSRNGGFQGIGFAIPANLARHVVDSLVTTGRVVRGFLGVTIQDITPDLAEQFHLKSTKGVIVSDITPDSPAARRMTEVAKIGAEVVNTSNQALRAAQKAIRNAAESARETIHEATKPPKK